MEVYAIIFMILGSYVLSSSTVPFITRQKDKSYIEGQIQRIPIVYFQNDNSDHKDNKLATAVGYIVPFKESHQERSTKTDSNFYNSPNREDNMISALTSLSEFRCNTVANNFFVAEVKNDLLSHNERSDDSDKKTETGIGSWTMVTKIDGSLKHGKYNSIDSIKTDGASTSNPLLDYLTRDLEDIEHASRRKSVSPWVRFCSTRQCNFAFETTTCDSETPKKKFRPYSPQKHSRKHRHSTFLPFLKTTFNTGYNWLFYTHPSKYLGNIISLPDASVEETIVKSKYINASGLHSSTGTEDTEECLTVSSTDSSSSLVEEGIYSKPLKGIQMHLLSPKERVYKRAIKTTHDRSNINEHIWRSNSDENVKKQFKFDVKPHLKPIKDYKWKRRVKRSAAHVVFFPLGRNDQKTRNGSRRRPPCPKSCLYNFTELLNAHKIKPPEYYKYKGPSLLLCCPTKDDSYTSTNKTSRIDSLNATSKPTLSTQFNVTSVSPKITRAPDRGIQDNTTVNTYNAPATSGDVTATSGANTTATSVDDVGQTSAANVSPSGDMIDNTTEATLYKILMQFRDIKTNKEIRPLSTTPMEQFLLKLIVRNDEDSIDSFELGSDRDAQSAAFQWPLKKFFLGENKEKNKERPLQVYVKEVRRRKKTRPWDRFCPCIGSSTCCTEVTNVNNQPWVSTCCYDLGPVTSKKETEEAVVDDDLVVKTLGYSMRNHSVPIDKGFRHTQSSSEAIRSIMPVAVSSGTSSYKPDIRYINAKRHDILNIIQDNPDNKDNLVVLVRVPLAVAQKYSDEGVIKLVLPVNNTLLRKYVKPRSILNQLIPSILRKGTTTKHHVAKPWEEPWKFQTQFNLFSSSAPGMQNIGDKHGENRFKNPRTEIISCDESISDDIFLKSSKSPIINKFKLGGESYQLYEEGSEAANIKNVEGSDDKCITYLLKFPKDDSITNDSTTNVVSPISQHCRKVPQTTARGVMLLQKFGNPPKYFIEVPDTLGEIIKKAANLGCQISHHQIIKERKNLTKGLVPQKISLKPLSHNRTIVLHLQPFEVNGHKVYLPLPKKKKTEILELPKSTIEPNDEFVDYLETANHLGNSNSQPTDDLFTSHDASMPFALIPAYLTFHPKSQLSYDLNVRPKNRESGSIFCREKCPDIGSSEKMYSKTKKKVQKPGNVSGVIPIEEKWLKLAKQIENTLQNPLPLGKGIQLKHQESLSDRPIGCLPQNPSYLVLMKDTGDPSVVEIALPGGVGSSRFSQDERNHFTLVDYKADLATIRQIEVTLPSNLH